MRLTRIYVEAELKPGTLLELPRDTAAHLAKVLRARSGDALVLFSGDGREYSGAVDSVRGSRVTAAIGNAVEVDRESSLAVTLVQCIARGDRMDFIVQKAVELGVARIVPVMSQRSVVRLDAAQAESKAAHWRAVAVSACEQCGRNRLPAVDAPTALASFLGDLPQVAEPYESRVVLDPEAPGSDAHSVGVLPGCARVTLAIGPEGGFEAEELAAFRLVGFAAVRLGPRILRTETAAIAGLAWLQTCFGDIAALGAPPPPR